MRIKMTNTVISTDNVRYATVQVAQPATSRDSRLRVSSFENALQVFSGRTVTFSWNHATESWEPSCKQVTRAALDTYLTIPSANSGRPTVALQ